MWRNQWPSIQLWRDQEATAASKRPQGKHEQYREEVTASLAAAVAISSDVAAAAVLLDLNGIFVGQLWLWQTEGLFSLPPGFLWTLYQMGIQEKFQLLCQVHGCVPFVSYFFQLPEGEQWGKEMPMQWQWTNTMQTLEIMQSESASITLIFQRLGMFYHSITGYTSRFLNCIMLKTLNQSYRQDRVYIGVRRNSLAVQNAQLMTQVTRQCPCIVFHQLSGHAASQRGEDTEYRARRRWMRPPRVAGDTLPCDVQ